MNGWRLAWYVAAIASLYLSVRLVFINETQTYGVYVATPWYVVVAGYELLMVAVLFTSMPYILSDAKRTKRFSDGDLP